jgi:putative DNA primase/helicase
MSFAMAEPKSSVDALVALSDLVSPMSAFVRDRCNTGPDHEVLIDDLWAAWKIWAEDNRHRVGTKQLLGRDLRSVVPQLRVARPRDGKSDARFRKYEGIALQPTMEKTADHADH